MTAERQRRGIRWLWAALALLAAAPLHAEVYRCRVDGLTQFSDRPCGPAAQAAELPPVTVVQPEPGTVDLAKEHEQRREAYRKARAAEDADWRARHEQDSADAARIRAARQRREVVSGMRAAEVRQLLGLPTAIDRDDQAGVAVETWTYRDGKRRGPTVTLRDGVVVKVRGSKAAGER